MSDKLDARLKAFTYQRPSQDVQETMGALRTHMQDLTIFLDASVPECREKSLAFTALEEASMWAMKALSHTDADSVQESP